MTGGTYERIGWRASAAAVCWLYSASYSMKYTTFIRYDHRVGEYEDMKAPKLEELSTKAPADAFTREVMHQKARASVVIRKTFSLEQHHMDHLLAVASEAMQAAGKTISASEALRIIIDRDKERAGK